MDLRAFLALKVEHGEPEAIVHSHIYAPPIPSDADLTACESTGVPWLIVNFPLGAWRVIEPCGYKAPLIGRQWAWGVLDCYSVVRDGLRDLGGIDMPDFDREWKFWERGANTIEDNLAAAGLVKVAGDWRDLDVIGMRIRAPVTNHLGLFLKPDVILHQMMGRYSVREVYGGVYAMATTLHLRHQSLMEAGDA
jgi:cell wall-associated NlpC family hydrolase